MRIEVFSSALMAELIVSCMVGLWNLCYGVGCVYLILNISGICEILCGFGLEWGLNDWCACEVCRMHCECLG